MSNEEIEYINGMNAERRERYCRRARLIDMSVRWGGWLVAGLILMANLAALVH